MNALEERILECFPSGSYALSALLRLMDIVESDKVPTAAVECRIQPRLLINPEFVSAHADTPEQLLMLVMHELHHVLLGHTTLFPTATATIGSERSTCSTTSRPFSRAYFSKSTANAAGSDGVAGWHAPTNVGTTRDRNNFHRLRFGERKNRIQRRPFGPAQHNRYAAGDPTGPAARGGYRTDGCLLR